MINTYVFLDLEYFSISKKLSTYKELLKNQRILFPEIFQVSFLICKKNLKKYKIFNFYLKTKKEIPNRLIKLCGVNKKKIVRISFKRFLKFFLNKINKKNLLIICNGDDLKLLKKNISYNKIQKELDIKLNFLNLRKLSKKLFLKEYDTYEIKKKFKINKSLKLHNAANDVLILFHAFYKISNIWGKERFDKIIKNITKKMIL